MLRLRSYSSGQFSSFQNYFIHYCFSVVDSNQLIRFDTSFLIILIKSTINKLFNSFGIAHLKITRVEDI